MINSVQFSNHTGYKEGFEGDVLKGDQLRALMSGLRRNDLLPDIGHVLTGYIGSASFLEAFLDALHMVREACARQNPNHQVRYVCDPVLGDKGKFYVPMELVPLYKEKVIPLADVVTPNQFEIEQLTGITLQSMADAQRACHVLHDMGPSLVFITSIELDGGENASSGDSDPRMAIVASERSRQPADTTTTTQPTTSAWMINCPILPGHYIGTGDLTAALLLAYTAQYGDHCNSDETSRVPTAMENVVNTLFAVIQWTSEHAGDSIKSRELKLIQCKDIIEHPPQQFKAVRLENM